MAAVKKDPRMFFTKGTVAQFEFVLELYEEAIILKANQKNRKPDEFIKLDRWYQKDLPKKIKSRGKDAHLTHEELIKCMKWKLNRGKFSPRLKDLITMNTPRLCMAETKKAFRALQKKEDLPMAVQALCNLKGVGPAMASAILTAADPVQCGFMADECLLAIPDIESIDYTTRELLNFVHLLKGAADRLNSENGGITGEAAFNVHKVEVALWTHFVLADLNKELLEGMPSGPTENGIGEDEPSKNGPSPSPSDSSADKENRTQIHTNGASEDSRSALSLCEDTNDSIAISEAPSESISELNNINSEIDEDSQDTRDLPSSSSSSPVSPKPLDLDSEKSQSQSLVEINSNSSSNTEVNSKSSIDKNETNSKAETNELDTSSVEKQIKETNSSSGSPPPAATVSPPAEETTADEPPAKKIKLDQ